jgi:hypothetical protein
MNHASRTPAPLWPLWAGLIAALFTIALAAGEPTEAAHGWLVAFFLWSSAPLGALALALIQMLTGGRWADAMAPTIRIGLAAVPVLFFFYLILLIGLHALYPWARSASAAAPDVARLYLNAPSFIARDLLALTGCTIIALFLIGGRLSLLGAALGLAFYGLTVFFTPIDWALSLEPHFTNSSFGATIATQHLMTTLALAAIIQPARATERANGDIGALLLAVSLGAVYLGLMTFIVKWYGDQPDDAAWYLARVEGAGLLLLVGAVALGATVPIVALAWERARASATALRLVGSSTLAGVILHDFWLIAPQGPWLAAAVALSGLAAMAGLSVGLAFFIDRRIGGARAAARSVS